mgnify:CR=1 FL=1
MTRIPAKAFQGEPQDYRNYIDGAFVESGTGVIEVLNPANGRLLGRIPDTGPDQVDAAVKAARHAQAGWERLPAIERAGYLRQVSARLREHRLELADVIVKEQGKVRGLAQVEVDFTADYIDYMAEWARRIEGEVLTSDRPNETMLLLRKPIGVVAGILPWNFPFFLIARKMAPALVTGNTIVIKPSEVTPRFVAPLVRTLADIPELAGIVTYVQGDGATGAALVDRVDGICFTGSTATGRKVRRQHRQANAAKARRARKAASRLPANATSTARMEGRARAASRAAMASMTSPATTASASRSRATASRTRIPPLLRSPC